MIFPNTNKLHYSFQIHFFRLGLYRDAEKQLKSALRDEEIVDTYLYLYKVYTKLDQPLTAIEVYLKVGHDGCISFGLCKCSTCIASTAMSCLNPVLFLILEYRKRSLIILLFWMCSWFVFVFCRVLKSSQRKQLYWPVLREYMRLVLIHRLETTTFHYFIHCRILWSLELYIFVYHL